MIVNFKYRYLLIICFLLQVSLLRAQWTERDSLWLQDVVSGRDTLRLNPETMKAIREGSFLNLDGPQSPMMSSPSEFPIVKDFSEFIKPLEEEENHRIVPLNQLPFSVFKWTGHDLARPVQRYKVNPDFFRLPGLLAEDLRWAPRSSGVGFINTLSILFSPEYRQHRHNRVHAIAYKTYNNLPTKEERLKQQKYHEQQAALPLPTVTVKAKEDTVKKKKQLKDFFLIADSILKAHRKDSIFAIKPIENWNRLK